MRTKSSAAPFVPDTHTLPVLKQAADGCQGCDLYKSATQTVFGEGAAQTSLMLVGETPGDKEDREGHPFVGPAGKLLDRALAAAEIDRTAVYVTNAVKHFRWVLQGDRRLHQKPLASQVSACRPWLEAEIDAVKPRVIVALGATAAQSLLGNSFRITADRGKVIKSQWAEAVLATWHPSAILRAPTDEDREAMMAALIADLSKAREMVG